MTKAVLVTGGAGYIGSHTCKALAAAGYLPVTLDDLSQGKKEFVRWGPLVTANTHDKDTVVTTLKQYQIDMIIDLAGSIEVGESIRNPLTFYENNVSAKIALLQAAHACKVRAYIFSSSAAVYGEAAIGSISEDHPLQPTNPYGWSKLFFEQMLQDSHVAGGPPWIALRYFNAAGASDAGEIGEARRQETHLIPRACMAALGTLASLEIYGNDHPTPDGTAIRDYVHVTDLAAAHVSALNNLLQGGPCGAYNLGNGHGISVREVIECFSGLGLPVPHHFKPKRAGDPSRLVANTALAQRILGWQPVHSDIETIIRSAYQWHQKQIQKP